MEYTTCEVADWLESLGQSCYILCGEDFTEGALYAFRIGKKGKKVKFIKEGKEIDFEALQAVWFRRYGNYNLFDSFGETSNLQTTCDIINFSNSELNRGKNSLFNYFQSFPTLTRLNETTIDKIYALEEACKVGLSIPETIVCNNKDELIRFKSEVSDIIIKPLSDGLFFIAEGNHYGIYTEELNDDDIAMLPLNFITCLIQQKLEKQYEVRTFYLAGKCYSMAIFSQEDKQTEVDFRRYNIEHPNRLVPYQLPETIEQAVVQFMNKVSLSTGSLDFVYTKSGEHVFLEVNPVGQFGMVSIPCNYYLEKLVAEHLIELTL